MADERLPFEDLTPEAEAELADGRGADEPEEGGAE